MGVGHEPFGGTVRLIPISAREALAAQIQFPRHADRHRFLAVVEDVGFEVVEGTADGDRAGETHHRIIGHDSGQGADGRFRGAIMVDDGAGRLPPHLIG
ncbi:MAG: hypothetical protein NBKEAIPA_03690 [Nitrospirae bacterium]|nr:hypothetical protein [Nitrospirota bacterium]